mmetsp:Transcript_17237/g.44031  ORF Transcript_17237/g.44031 Transcript_17237/m.44031 type:complete len:115 (-) Transcript_17237:532-876(-)
MGQIVYDGFIESAALPGFSADINGIIAAAVRDGKVISRLPDALDAPLEGRWVGISWLQARPELNGLVGFAGDFDEGKGRYSVRLPGSDAISVRPGNLREATEAEVQVAMTRTTE